MSSIPIAGPSITETEVAAVENAVREAWYGEANRPIERFEQNFASQVGRRFAISLPSCTSGLHLVLAALGIGPGDEVVVPDATWIASAAPISYVGATPVFADVHPDTWCLTDDSLKKALSERTRAVIAVDLYGGMPDFDALQRTCEDAQIHLIEDAAEAIGSLHRGRPAGSFGSASAFSFHGSKTLTTGEGGMVVTDDESLYERMMVLRDHGRRPGDVAFFNNEVAFKYKMSALQAALGDAQLSRLSELVEMKRTIFDWYRARLGSTAAVTLNAEPEGTLNSYWMTTAVIDPGCGLTKVEIGEQLERAGIATRPFFHPLSGIPAYANHPQAGTAAASNPVSYRLGTYGINLPSALCLTEQDVDRVCTELLRVLGSAGS